MLARPDTYWRVEYGLSYRPEKRCRDSGYRHTESNH